MKSSLTRIDMLSGPDFKAALLGEFGLSGQAIAEHTGLSRGQVYNRLRKAQVRLKDYRNAVNPIGKLVLKGADKIEANQLSQVAEKNLKHKLRLLGWSGGGKA